MSRNLNSFGRGSFRRRVASGSGVVGAFRCLVNATSLQLQYAMVLHESLLVALLTHHSETMIRTKKRYRIKDGQPQRLNG